MDISSFYNFLLTIDSQDVKKTIGFILFIILSPFILLSIIGFIVSFFKKK